MVTIETLKSDGGCPEQAPANRCLLGFHYVVNKHVCGCVTLRIGLCVSVCVCVSGLRNVGCVLTIFNK